MFAYFFASQTFQVLGKMVIAQSPKIFNSLICLSRIMFFKRKKQQMKRLTDTEDNVSKCLCTECPTNPDSTSLYCARGITEKPLEKVRALGCSCALCPVFHEYNLSGCYLCLNKATETSQKNLLRKNTRKEIEFISIHSA